MDKKMMSMFENNPKEYFQNTIYNPNSLTLDLSEEEWYEKNPTRGIRQGIETYDLSKYSDSFLSKILNESYGEFEYNRTVIDNREYRFPRRTVACGGALYPNNIYLLISIDKKVKIFQYNPMLNLLNLVSIDESSSELIEGKIYFVLTTYYWRNWFKYRYFGYRLMLVDTGYLLANMCMVLSKYNLSYDISISNCLLKKIKKILNIDTEYESICTLISLDNKDLQESISQIEKFKVNYKLFKDWDTVPIRLYNKLEQEMINEKFDVSEKVKKGIDILSIPFNKKNRVSPGGEFMISRRNLENIRFKKSIEFFDELINEFGVISQGVKIYAYINKVDGINEGLYYLEKKNLIKEKNKIDFGFEHINNILRRKNFNLKEIPVLFFIGIDLEGLMNLHGLSGFKFGQIKIGFVSQLLSFSSVLNDCWTHSILGFDVKMIENMIETQDNINILNLMTFSERKVLDRFSYEF